MSSRRNRGSTVIEFLMTSLSLFLGLYLIFYVGFLASSYSLANYYLKDHAVCELKLSTQDCWLQLTRQMDSIRFIDIKSLNKSGSKFNRTVHLVYDFNLPPLAGLKQLENISLTSSYNLGEWQ